MVLSINKMREVRGPYSSKSNTHAPLLFCFSLFSSRAISFSFQPQSLVPSAFFSLQIPFFVVPIPSFRVLIFAPTSPALLQILIVQFLILDFSPSLPTSLVVPFPSLCFHRVDSIHSGRNQPWLFRHRQTFHADSQSFEFFFNRVIRHLQAVSKNSKSFPDKPPDVTDFVRKSQRTS